jgi:hypothetical protein
MRRKKEKIGKEEGEDETKQVLIKETYRKMKSRERRAK